MPQFALNDACRVPEGMRHIRVANQATAFGGFFQRMTREEETMLKTFAIALFAIVMSVGLAHATHAHKRMLGACAEGKQATARCTCGTGAGAAPTICAPGQWCHSFAHVCSK
jgi:hypothetical protein